MEMHIFCQDIYKLIRIIMKDGIISTVYHTLELLSFPYFVHTYCIRLLPPPDPVSLLLLPPPQSRQSAKLFLQSSELGLPHPFSRRPPFGPGGESTLACGRGVGGDLIPTRGHTLWGALYI